MVYFKNGFRNFNKEDYSCYSDVLKLPNGEAPKIFCIETKDYVGVDIILSGDGAGSTIITLDCDDEEYILSIPGYNSCHSAIADSIVDYFNDYEVTKEAIEGIVSDYEMKCVLRR